MSNIYQHNFDNCMKMRLSNSDYWDLFLCYDCTDEQDNDLILDECILIDMDINNDKSYSGDTIYSLTTWTGATVNGSGVTLYDIGLTAIDNGFLIGEHQPCITNWMTENFSGTTFKNGDPIPQATNASEWNNSFTNKTPAWCYVNFSPSNGTIYGKLYNWFVVGDPRGIGPDGYIVPSEEDFTDFELCLGGNSVAGGKMKTTGTIQFGDGLWNTPNVGATNESGFSGIPSGYKDDNGGAFGLLNDRASFWTTTEISDNVAMVMNLNNGRTDVFHGPDTKTKGYSIRLKKDIGNPLTCPFDSETFLSAFTGSTLFLSSADTRFSMTRVTGCTYEYPIDVITDENSRYSDLCGGFYQGFFKLSDKTYYEEITDNKFTWPLDWFRCPTICTGTTITDCCSSGASHGCGIDPNKAYECYLKLKPVPYNYQILPDRLGGLYCLDGWTATFWLNKKSTSCGGNTLNNLYPNNKGFFFYMGTRSENKFWDQFSGETGYTTSSGYPLPPPIESFEVLNNNPFLVYQPKGCCCFTGITTETISERDRNADIVDNALGFRITDDGSIGFRTVISSGVCSAVTATTVVDCHEQCGCGCTGTTTATTVTVEYVTGASIYECYSLSGLVTTDKWTHIAIRFKPYEQYTGCILETLPRRKGQLSVYVDGFLKWTLEDFDEFLFKELNEHREKQQGVPFNYSWGGGTQGLIETNTVNGPDIRDENLFLQNNFAGTFEGKVSTFKLYGCGLDVTTIREEYNQTSGTFYPTCVNNYVECDYIDGYFE